MSVLEKKFENLEKWQSTLASCIRCGYCYEHCPMFKHTRWETDAPRAKIITAFGLLSGNIEPTAAATNKLFNCFYCKRCEAACSSGVPLTEIFTDAKKDLVAMGIAGPGTTSVTHMDCAQCLICVRACPHEARYHTEDGIMTDPAKCQSCGICAALCPAESATFETTFGTGPDELAHRTAAFLSSHDNARFIVFACNWSYVPTLQSSRLPESEIQDKAYEILVNMCGGRLSAKTLMMPFLNKSRGVLVACCPDGECQHEGNEKAKVLVSNLKKTFENIGIDPDRIDLVQIPAGDKDLFQAEIDTFTEKMNTLGPIR